MGSTLVKKNLKFTILKLKVKFQQPQWLVVKLDTNEVSVADDRLLIRYNFSYDAHS